MRSRLARASARVFELETDLRRSQNDHQTCRYLLAETQVALLRAQTALQAINATYAGKLLKLYMRYRDMAFPRGTTRRRLAARAAKVPLRIFKALFKKPTPANPTGALAPSAGSSLGQSPEGQKTQKMTDAHPRASPLSPAPPRGSSVTDTLAVVHGGHVGDLIWHLPSVIWLTKHYGLRKARLYVRTDVPVGPGEISHPCGRVQITRAFAESIIPFLKMQDYLEDARIWQGEDVDVDLDVFRRTGFPFDRGDNAKWVGHAIPCAPRLWQPWLTVRDAMPNGMILVNRTLRNQNPAIHYRFLLRYPEVRFVGLREEYEQFKKEVNIRWQETKTFLDLARLIAGCRLFIGNQSAAYALAQGLMAPRVLEVSPTHPVAFVHGPNGFEAWSQPVLEEAARIMLAQGEDSWSATDTPPGPPSAPSFPRTTCTMPGP
jgi:hypothetical protein